MMQALLVKTLFLCSSNEWKHGQNVKEMSIHVSQVMFLWKRQKFAYYPDSASLCKKLCKNYSHFTNFSKSIPGQFAIEGQFQAKSSSWDKFFGYCSFEKFHSLNFHAPWSSGHSPNNKLCDGLIAGQNDNDHVCFVLGSLSSSLHSIHIKRWLKWPKTDLMPLQTLPAGHFLQT